MAFFTVKTDSESVRDGGDSKYINKSGMYEVTIKHAVVNTSANGSQTIDLYIESEGQFQPIYQAIRLTNNDGSPNFESKLFNKLCVVIGGEEGMEIADPVPENLPVGKGGESKECMVLHEFDDQPVHIRLQMEYSLYEGKVQQKKKLKNVFRFEDKATASEIVNNVEKKGEQYEKELVEADKVSYKDNLTEEDIKEWIKNRKSGKEEEVKKPATTSFTKKSFGKK